MYFWPVVEEVIFSVASPPGSTGGGSGSNVGTLERRVVSVRDEKVSVGPPNTAKTRVQLPSKSLDVVIAPAPKIIT